jgi:hypothetical protein
LSGVAANQLYRITAFGTLLNNVGSTQTIHFRGKIGATTVFSIPSGQFNQNTSASLNKWRYSWDIFFVSTTSQDNSAFFVGGQTNASPMVRITPNNTYVGYSASTEDFATAKNVVISVEMGSASASLEVTIEGYFIEKVS